MADDGVELSPDKVLAFNWDTAADTPQAVLGASNVSPAKYFVYKVKTTAPKRYVVRPPQGCVEPSGSAAIKLTMVAKDAEALWAEAADEQAAGLPGDVKCDDKFLVQTAEVSAAYYEQELKGKDDKALSATLAKLWKQLGDEDKAGGSGAVKKVKSAKLTTRFVFPKDMRRAAGGHTAHAPAASAPAAAAQAPTPAAPPSSFLADQPPAAPLSAAAPSAGGAATSAATPEAETLFAEFSALRKKYDDLVAYTVVLTGERDFLQQDCKDKEGALKKAEAAAKAAAAAGGSSAGGAAAGGSGAAAGGGTATKEATGPAGMSFSQVIAVALLAFIVGRVLS